MHDDKWLVDSITEVIQKLLEIEKATILPNEEAQSVFGDEPPNKDKSMDAAESYEDDSVCFLEKSLGSSHDLEATNEPETAPDDGKAANAADDEIEIVEKTNIPAALWCVDLVEEACEISTQVDMANFVTEEPEDGKIMVGLSGNEITNNVEDSVGGGGLQEDKLDRIAQDTKRLMVDKIEEL